ncbi:hypothetical protein [Pseudomonas protegens]|uniref:hypothetical protein n=1 Tax=Pseudomonas protegens TaxID=380021 RepID=UPI003839E3AA
MLHALTRNGHTGPHAGMNNGSPRALPFRTAADVQSPTFRDSHHQDNDDHTPH